MEVHAANTLNVGSSTPATEGRDSELRFVVWRNGDRSQPCSVEYRTLAGGTATPGLDFLPQTGVVAFAENEQFREVAVPIQNDGLVEGPIESVRVELLNPSPGMAIGESVGESFILDDELPATLDVEFRTSVGASAFAVSPSFGGSAFAVQPDGKILACGGEYGYQIGSRKSAVVRMHPDGRLDSLFYVDAQEWTGHVGLALAPDGGIMIYGGVSFVEGLPRFGIARLQLNGRLDRTFVPAAEAANFFADGSGQVIVLRSGRVLLWQLGDALPRMGALRRDGSLDEEFTRKAVQALDSFTAVREFIELRDGRLLCVAGSGTGEAQLQSLLMLREDATLDPGFKPVSAEFIARPLPFSDGRIAFVHRNGTGPLKSGSTDQERMMTFLSPQGRVEKTVPLPDATLLDPLLELDERIYWSAQTSPNINRPRILRTNFDGTLDRDFASPAFSSADSLAPARLFLSSASAQEGGLLCWKFPPLLDPLGDPSWGFHGLVKILTKNIPVASFAWANGSTLSRPAAVREGDSTVEVTVHRLGDTSKAATVDFATRDGRARSGLNYDATRGTLHFAPMETRRIIHVRLINNAVFQGAPEFSIELTQPSDRTSTLPPPLSVRIHDDEPGIIPESFWLKPSDELVGFSITFAPNVGQLVERSTDLRAWIRVGEYGFNDFNGEIVLDQREGGPWFYRTRYR